MGLSIPQKSDSAALRGVRLPPRNLGTGGDENTDLGKEGEVSGHIEQKREGIEDLLVS